MVFTHRKYDLIPAKTQIIKKKLIDLPNPGFKGLIRWLHVQPLELHDASQWDPETEEYS